MTELPLPVDLDAEESVLGALLLSDWTVEPVLDAGVAAADFYRGSHGVIFTAIVALYGEGKPFDPISVADRLAETGSLETVGGRDRVHELAALVPATSNVGHYARIVREQAVLRSLAAAGAEIARLGLERPGPVQDLLDRSESLIFDLTLARRASDAVALREALAETFERIEELHKIGADVIGVPTGFRHLDRLTAGLQPGNLVIVAGRPSMGKTAFALGVAANVSVRGELPVALFTVEMNRGEVTQRLLSSEALVESQNIRSGNLNVEEWRRVTDAAARLDPAPFLIDDSSMLTALELRSKARRMKMRQPALALVVVDYLQLMTSGGRAENRNQDVSQISRTLKVLAGELRVPVIALSQLSRQVEARHDKRPMLSDLRESGSLEQDADLVLLLYRDDYYHEDDVENDQRGVAEVNIAKHRNGPTGTVKLAFVERFARFADVAT